MRAEGEAEAVRGSILDVFASRGLAVGGEVRCAIAACRNVEDLRRWHRHAVTAPSAAAVFGSPGQ